MQSTQSDLKALNSIYSNYCNVQIKIGENVMQNLLISQNIRVSLKWMWGGGKLEMVLAG